MHQFVLLSNISLNKFQNFLFSCCIFCICQEKRAKEPDVSEFISALAAGNNAQLMVVACAGAADSTTLALVAAAQQTGGTVICILSGVDKLNPSLEFLHDNARHVEFVIGDAKTLVINDYRRADCIVIDCNLNNCEGIL